MVWGMGEGGGRCGVIFVVLASEPIGGDPGQQSNSGKMHPCNG